MAEGPRPEPGIYENVPFATYLAWDALSNSRMSAIAKSPLHFSEYEPPSGTTALRLGSLAHCGVLEPLSVAKRYAVMPDYHLDGENTTANGTQSTSVATNYVKDKQAEFRRVNCDKEIVSEADYEAMAGIVHALRRDRQTWELLSGEGPIELSLVWDDPATGIRCKARIDKVTGNRMADLKTTGNIFKFQRSIVDYAYHRQMAHYQRGYAVLTGELLEPWLVPVESSKPHVVMAAPLGDDTLALGERKLDEALATIAECKASGVWPGPEPPSAWDVPEWALVDNSPLELTIGGKTVEV